VRSATSHSGPNSNTICSSRPPATPESVPQPVITLCGNGSCPTVYRTDHDTGLVQGNTAHDITVPDGELLVEIRQELLLEAARRIQEQEA
jgi:hypothetical protein